MSDQHPASTSDARKRLRCGLCGDPARGYATIGDTRYCHEGDDPTCYQKAQKAPEAAEKAEAEVERLRADLAAAREVLARVEALADEWEEWAAVRAERFDAASVLDAAADDLRNALQPTTDEGAGA